MGFLGALTINGGAPYVSAVNWRDVLAPLSRPSCLRTTYQIVIVGSLPGAGEVCRARSCFAGERIAQTS